MSGVLVVSAGLENFHLGKWSYRQINFSVILLLLNVSGILVCS